MKKSKFTESRIVFALKQAETVVVKRLQFRVIGKFGAICCTLVAPENQKTVSSG